MSDANDKKDAVNIGVTLSTQIMAASLTMIAVIGAFAAFIIDKRNVGVLFYLINGGAFFCFVASIFLGGKGINKVRVNGFDGKWLISETKHFFNWQSIFALLGIILFSISVFIGDEKSDELKAQVNNQQQKINRLQSKNEANSKDIQKLTSDVFVLREQLKALSKKGSISLPKSH